MAASTIVLFSSIDSIARTRFVLGVVLGVVPDLSALGIAATDDPSLDSAVNERNVELYDRCNEMLRADCRLS